MSFSPNLKILSDWRGSLTAAFSTLRRIAFTIEGDFAFGDFDPKFNGEGMTVTNYVTGRARYLKIFKMLWISVDISMTLGATFATEMQISLPNNYTVAGINNSTSGFQGGSLCLQNAGVSEAGIWLALPTSSNISIRRGAGGAYTGGDARFIFNAFLEVL